MTLCQPTSNKCSALCAAQVAARACSVLTYLVTDSQQCREQLLQGPGSVMQHSAALLVSALNYAGETAQCINTYRDTQTAYVGLSLYILTSSNIGRSRAEEGNACASSLAVVGGVCLRTVASSLARTSKEGALITLSIASQ